MARELTQWAPDWTHLGPLGHVSCPRLASGAVARRPGGGLRATRDVKREMYAPLQVRLVAKGYAVMGVTPPPLLQNQEEGEIMTDSQSYKEDRRAIFPVAGRTPSGALVSVPIIHAMVFGATGVITADVIAAFVAAGVTGSHLQTTLQAIQVQAVADARMSLIIHHRASAQLDAQVPAVTAGASGGAAGPFFLAQGDGG